MGSSTTDVEALAEPLVNAKKYLFPSLFVFSQIGIEAFFRWRSHKS
jgi:hypothetical protein